jgi:hypothetical protein
MGEENNMMAKRLVLIADEKQGNAKEGDRDGNKNPHEHILILHAISAPI